jgi:ABC-type sulfate transport system substrate-binding protein
LKRFFLALATAGLLVSGAAQATINGDFGGWTKAQSVHFADGGVFDQIYQPGR